jgi:hypothetical protein
MGSTRPSHHVEVTTLREGILIMNVKYRVFKEERSIFWEVIVSVILRKKVPQ